MIPSSNHPACDTIARRRPTAPALYAMLLLATLLLSSCAPVLPPQPGGMRMIDDRLYFGRSIPSGGSVSDAEWERFVGEVILHHFPDGHTVWRAEGAWRDSTGAVVRESSFVLELLHVDDAAVDSAIDTIIAAYKRRFRQEAVLWVRIPAQVRF